ncbi:MAG: hypothetical protein FWH57_10015 [Oscillospiraceae bacterium]|nr:hypothetical protein [Oscillospiraceae bacterium]
MGENENLPEEVSLNDFSLESILAEYKGSAFINGDKKTPPDLLREQTEKIMKEAVEPVEPTEPDPPLFSKKVDAVTDGSMSQKTEEKDSVILFFENYRSPIPEGSESIAQDVEKALQKELGIDPQADAASEIDRGVFMRFGDGAQDDEEEQEILEDEVFEEPDLRQAGNRFVEAFASTSLRGIPAALITLVMVILTFAFEAGLVIPFGIGRERTLATGALVLGLLIVMMLCVDLIVRGASFLLKGAPNAETLLLFSCVFSLFSAGFSMLRDLGGILPYCAISAFSLSTAAIGERYNLRAIAETIKTATGSTEPYGVMAEYIHDIDKSVLKKAYNATDGFYNNLMHPDIVETAYRYATPVLIAAALVLSIFAALVKGQGEYFLHIMSALFAAAAPFSLMLAFAVPFSAVARTIRRSGAAIAGWGGADDVCFTDGACVTDDDLFPPGTLKLNGLKLYEGISPEKAIRYTASLIIASGSGLANVFSDLLKSQGMLKIKVEEFACYEGGISALLRGERVAIGSVGFMNLLGFRIPDDMNMKNAVYTAINDKMVAVFAVDYTPANSVQSALISILKWRIKLFFAVRDFNVTPLMLEQKFRVSLEEFSYVQAKDSYNISDSYSKKEGRIAAILIREGFGPFAEAVTGARLLKSAALIATVASIISAALGVIIMFFMCWSGSFASAKPGNLMLFMISMLAVVLIICGYVRCRK